MGNIVLLDDLTINKIAAGEVIERPASVVKELMENSIDAGAKNITAEIKNGGITYIRITDDGRGILPDDMEIAFERHATSKIRTAKDLEVVKSMGFRGEALASIAAIARVEMTSKTEDSELGYKIVVEGGKIISKEVVGCPKGTTIIVEDLFFNTPVRYKFLKKDFTELGYIEDAVTRLALVNPDIAIKLINLGKNIIKTTGNGSIKDTVYSIYGKEIAENIISVDYAYEDMKITGCIGKPEIAKLSRSNQLFFVNKRYVKDKTLTSAAEQAFKGELPAGKYAFLILNVEIDSHKIDVNVHPAKLEIRFQEESNVFKLVYHAIKDTLALKSDAPQIQDSNFLGKAVEEPKTDYLPSFKLLPDEEVVEEESTGNLIEDLYNQKLKEKEQSELKDSVIPESKLSNSLEDVLNTSIEKNDETQEVQIQQDEGKDNFGMENLLPELENEESTSTPSYEEESIETASMDSSFEEMYKKTFGIAPINVDTKQERISEEHENTTEMITSEISGVRNIGHQKYKVIGFAFSTYILVEMNDDLYIIDQKMANEKIVYERMIKTYNNRVPIESQQMLLPDIINLTSKQMAIAMDNFTLFTNSGFDIEEFGENTIKLSGVPEICIDLDTKELFIECLNRINTIARTAHREIEEVFIQTIATKIAESKPTVVTFEEADKLIKNLMSVYDPFESYSGRNVAIKMTKADIEKKF